MDESKSPIETPEQKIKRLEEALIDASAKIEELTTASKEKDQTIEDLTKDLRENSEENIAEKLLESRVDYILSIDGRNYSLNCDMVRPPRGAWSSTWSVDLSNDKALAPIFEELRDEKKALEKDIVAKDEEIREKDCRITALEETIEMMRSVAE